MTSQEEEDEKMMEPLQGMFDSDQPAQQQQQQPEQVQMDQPSNGAATFSSRRRPTTKSQWSYLAHRLAVYGRTTSMPGVNRLTEAPSNASRIYWCLLGLLASSFCIYHVVWLIYAFETSPVSSVLRQGATPFVFPDVTICSMTPTDATLINDHINEQSKLRYFYWTIFIPPRLKQQQKIRELLNTTKLKPDVRRKILRFLQLQKINVSMPEQSATTEVKTESIKQLFKLLRGTFNMYAAGFTLDSLIIRCKFEGHDCKKSELRLVVDNHLWNCYTMRPNARNVTTMEGLDLFILTHQQHYTEDSDSQTDIDSGTFIWEGCLF